MIWRLVMNNHRVLLEKLIKASLDCLYIYDKYLIVNEPPDNPENHVSERSIVFRFGIYFQHFLSVNPLFKDYDLDCEYNRYFYDKKTLPGFKNGVYPDLIIHKRGNMEQNLLVMEFKSWWNCNNQTDTEKIKHFIDPNGSYQYQYGVSIIVKKNEPELEWFPK